MDKIIARPNQTLLDIILMEYGTLEAGMLVAREKDLSITLLPAAGTELTLPQPLTAENNAVLDSAALNYLRQNEIVVGTRGIQDPLAATIVLKPKMQVVPNVVGPPHVIGFYSFDFISSDEFINVFGLLDSYLTTNEVYYQTEELHIAGVPIEAALPPHPPLMTSRAIPYYLPWTAGWGYMMVWSPPSAPVPTVTFKDINGNTATVAPLIILSNISQDLVLYLIADIEIETIASSVSEVTLKLSRTHPASFVPDFNDYYMTWTGAALDAMPDPDDPLNEDVRILTVPAGSYTMGVETSYVHPFGHVFPSSIFSMVITVA